MIILCDSREQIKKGRDTGLMTFEHDAIEWCQICTLPFGDYWAVFKNGRTSRYIVERKAVGDFFGSFAGHYKAERKKLQKFLTNELGIERYIVAIEGTIGEVLDGYKHSTKPGRDLFRTMMTWYVRYDVDIWYQSREDLEFAIPELFYSEGIDDLQKT